MRIDNVYEVADASRGMVGSVEMDMDTAGLVRKSAGFPEPPCQSLHPVNILPVKQDGADQLHAVTVISGDSPAPFFFLTMQAAIVHHFPDMPIRSGYFVGVIIIPGSDSRAT